MIARRLAVALAALTLAQTVVGQRFETYSTQDGLPSVVVESLATDEAGFLWIATQGGLARFDGSNFRVFKASPSVPGHLRDEFIHAVLPIGRTVFVGTNSGGLHALNTDTGVFARAPMASEALQNDVRSLAFTRSGALLVGTQGGLLKTQTQLDSLVLLTPEFSEERAKINHLVPSRYDNLVWVATNDGLVLFDEMLGRPTRVDGLEAFAGVIEHVVETDSALFAASTQGLLAADLRRVGGRIELSKFRRLDSESGLVGNHVTALAQLSGGEQLAIGTEAAGVQVAHISGSLLRFGETSGTSDGLGNSRVWALQEDHHGVLWVGTWGGGLSRRRPAARFRSIRAGEPGAETLPKAPFLYVHAPRSRPLHAWIATIGRGAVLWDREAGTFEAHFDRPGHPLQSTSAIHEDAAGRLWMAGSADSLYLIRNDGRAEIELGVPLARQPDPGWVHFILESMREPGILWIATQRAGLIRFDSNSGRVVRQWLHDPADERGIPSSEVWGLWEEPSGPLWIGTVGGLARLEADSETFTRFVHDPANPQSLSSDRIVTVAQDTTGAFWLGTSDRGFNRLDPATGLVKRFMPENGLPDDEVGNLTVDGSGILWLATNNGLARLDPYNEQFSYFQPSDGLHGLVFTYLASATTASGEILLTGTSGGITHFHPASLPLYSEPPRVVITRLLVEDRDRLPAPAVERIPALVESFRNNDIEIHFAALDFREPSKNRFRVHLSGADEHPSAPMEAAFVRYPNLAPGKYEFKVWAANADGFWNDKPAAVSITITPPFWRSTWFYLVATLLLIGGTTALYRYRLSQLALIELERRRIADDLHDDLGGRLSGLAMRLELLSRSADSRQRDNLLSLSNSARRSAAILRDTIWLVGSSAETLPHLVTRLETAAQELLTGVSYEFVVAGSIPEREMRPSARRDLFLLFRECVHNVAKHSQAKHARITIRTEGGWVGMEISDDGIGFDEEVVGTGNGHRTMRERARRLGADLRIESRVGGGTRVVIRAPLGS